MQCNSPGKRAPLAEPSVSFLGPCQGRGMAAIPGRQDGVHRRACARRVHDSVALAGRVANGARREGLRGTRSRTLHTAPVPLVDRVPSIQPNIWPSTTHSRRVQDLASDGLGFRPLPSGKTSTAVCCLPQRLPASGHFDCGASASTPADRDSVPECPRGRPVGGNHVL